MFPGNSLYKLKKQRELLTKETHFEKLGRVVQVIGTVIEVTLSDIPLGSLVRIFNKENSYSLDQTQ